MTGDVGAPVDVIGAATATIPIRSGRRPGDGGADSIADSADGAPSPETNVDAIDASTFDRVVNVRRAVA